MITRILYPAIAVISIAFLGYTLFLRGPAPAPPPAPADPRQILESYLQEDMNFGTDFAIRLAEKRIDYARRIAVEHPEFEPFALRVADSLQARLDRRAVME